MRGRVAALLLVIAAPAGAAPLDEAITLALAASDKLAAAQEESRLTAEEPDWSADVRLGYNRAQTDERASGFDAGVTVTIPLWDHSSEREAAKARGQVAEERRSIRTDLVKATRDLVQLAVAQEQTAELAKQARDRLTYYRRRVDQGMEEAADLWPHAARAKKAEHSAEEAAAEYQAELEAVARQYGGNRWKKLRDLLDAHVKRNVPSR